MIFWNICQKCHIYCQKNLLMVSENPEILYTTKLTRAQKKPKYFFSRALNMVKMGSEIYKYLLSFFSIYK